MVNKPGISIVTVKDLKPVTDNEVQSPRQQMGATFVDLSPINSSDEVKEQPDTIPSGASSGIARLHITDDANIAIPVVEDDDELRKGEALPVQDIITQVSRDITPHKANIAKVREKLKTLGQLESTIVEPSETTPSLPYCCALFSCLFPSHKIDQIQLKKVRKQIIKTSFLPPKTPEENNMKLLLLDLDETLVHSSFKPVERCDFKIDVEIEDIVHHVYVLVRPKAREFLEAVAEHYELGIFTASLAKYANPVLDLLDPKKLIKYRLFREHCVFHKGTYVKDLEMLGRDLSEVIIIDNSPACYIFQPNNAIPITSWFDDFEDDELMELVPFLRELKECKDVSLVLDSSL